ncbi:MAG: PAS domain S-box protein [Anaerolineaceae bacterium]|nr:PAS domain S-box protein [Anaerolineaceae bacterium]
MPADIESSEIPITTEISLADLLRSVLTNFAHDIQADIVAIYSYSHDLKEEALIVALPERPPQIVDELVRAFCIDGQHASTRIVNPNVPDFALAQFFLFKLADEAIGALVVLSHSQPAGDITSPQLKPCLSVIQNLLQNHYRIQSEAISHTIQAIARQVGEGVSPQDLVNLVSEHLLEPGIRFCALLMYGPRREDRPNGPFAYLDLQGVWSSRFPAGVGVGMHLYLDQYTEMIQEIEARKIWHVPDVKAIETRFDSLTRGFIRGADTNSIVIIALESFGRPLGFMVIGTGPDREFSQQELRSYQVVSEFLALRAMAHVLKQEQDIVQQGRAALLDAVHDGVLMILPSAGSVTGDNSKTSVLTVNQAFSSLFGISQLRVQGLSLPQLLSKMQLPEDVRQSLKHHWLAATVRDPSIQRGDFSMIHPDGYHSMISWYSAPVYQANRVMGRIYIFHDVTDDRTAVSLRANFVSRMSHELRTPLTSIKGFAQYMLEELGADLTPAVTDYVKIIMDNAQLLNTLFTDIIEITRADVGDLKVNTSTTRLGDLVEHVVAQFESHPLMEHKSIVRTLDPNAPAVQIDSGRISRVLSQVIKNALQHTPDEGVVRITTQWVTHTGQLPFGAPSDVIVPGILVTIEDQGEGISVEDSELIFLPFYRTRESRAARLEGSGLGLAIARSMLTLHRGKIWAEPRRRGRRSTRFYFILPTTSD